MVEASAPGKIILCGEHAVVYGRPAIALPLADVRAYVAVRQAVAGSGIAIDAPDLQRRWTLADAPEHPLSELVASVFDGLAVAATPDLQIQITSAIPIASGMGSGAAIATALVRALAAQLGRKLPAAEVSALVYASERRFHGTPSGIDNSVIAYEQPIWFKRRTTNDERRTTRVGEVSSSFVLHPSPIPPINADIEPLDIAAPFTLLIGDTGLRSPTHLPVGEVRRRWQAEPARYEALFDAVATLVVQARAALLRGDLAALGALLNENHALLTQIGVSSNELDRLVAAARAGGALGAKLSGAGWGGVMIALVGSTARRHVAQALRDAGAIRVLETTVLHNSVYTQ
jgi:mevalonate kinase